MKRAKFFNLFLATVILATVASGCKKTPKNITPISNPNMRAPGSDQLSGLNNPNTLGNRLPQSPLSDQNLTGGRSGELANPLENANEDRSTFAGMTIYFEFDRSAIKPSEQGKLDQVATWLKGNNDGSQLRVEGNCDERGTEEYNRSLGERRAVAARDYLIQKHGIASDRITTVSYGESKPVDLGKTEEAYAKNRRDEFVLLRAK